MFFKLAKNADSYKYIYTRYSIGFDLHSEFSLHDVSVGKKVIIFGTDITSSVHIDNKKKDILILANKSSVKNENISNRISRRITQTLKLINKNIDNKKKDILSYFNSWK